MNWGPWSGGHKAYHRRGGEVSENERSSFRSAKDAALKWALVAIGSGCLTGVGAIYQQGQKTQAQQAVIQSQIATLIERTANQNSREDRHDQDIAGLRVAQAELQRQIEEVRTRR